LVLLALLPLLVLLAIAIAIAISSLESATPRSNLEAAVCARDHGVQGPASRWEISM
jgi:hypothetical protein